MNVIASIDQGTTSTRCLLFDKALRIVAGHQVEHKQFTPHSGWLEHDPEEIFVNTVACIDAAVAALKKKHGDTAKVVGVGITNQRETTVVWDRTTGKPLHNAIVWSDARTQGVVARFTEQNGGADFARSTCGLPCTTYFSAMKWCWLRENSPQVRSAVEAGTILFGTVDSWLIWKLTGTHHVTDCTNASRTMLMDITTLQWSERMCDLFGMPKRALPRIVSNSEPMGSLAVSTIAGTPISGCVGDQQGALIGQMCFKEGDAKNTYGTGCFLLMHTGPAPKESKRGLLTTVGYKLGKDAPTQFALEGAVAGAGSSIQWMRDQLGLFKHFNEVQGLASSVADTGDVVFVPAFSGLFAPYWRADARGVICGITQRTNRAHVVRAALEAVAQQSAAVMDAMVKDSGVQLRSLAVDGGLARNHELLKMQADISGVAIRRPKVLETTAMGAAICAGLCAQMWSSTSDVMQSVGTVGDALTVEPTASAQERRQRKALWEKGVQRSLNWAKL